MRIKIVVHTGVTEEGSFQPGDTPNIREATAEEWIKRGWAIPRPDLEEKSKAVPPPHEVETADIETPEDHSGLTTRETAIIKRKKK